MNSPHYQNLELEEVLSKALELREQGKPKEEILALFPEHKSRLEDIFKIVEIIANEKGEIVPPPELLSSILKQLPEETVTDFEKRRYYLYRGKINPSPNILGEEKGRASLLSIIKNQYTMAPKWKEWKVIIPASVFALAVVLVVVTQLIKTPEFKVSLPTGQQPSPTESPAESLTPSPEITDNTIDNATAVIFSNSLDEISQIIKAMDDDVALIDFDSQAISDFGQSYNENEF